MRHTLVSLDPNSFVTSCHMKTAGRGDLALLAEHVDPLGWSAHSPAFWRASFKVIPGPQGGFIRDPQQPRLGKSWAGVLYESVRSSWHGLPISSVDNYLNIKFDVTDAEISMTYSLHHCAGGELLAGISPCFMDVDRGFLRAQRDETGLISIEMLKCIRFADASSRRTRGQGALGSGQALNRATPAVLERWMNGLVTDSISRWETEAVRAPASPSRGQAPRGSSASRGLNA